MYKRQGLRAALRALKSLEQDCHGDSVLSNMLLAARLITASALQRKESRGGHYRSDFPKTTASLAQRTFITLADLARIEAPHPVAEPETSHAGFST